MKPTLEQIRQWEHEALESYLNNLRKGIPLGEIPGLTDQMVILAASWAREQALKEAAMICERMSNESKTAADEPACWECADSIRALKEKYNEHAPIPR